MIGSRRRRWIRQPTSGPFEIGDSSLTEGLYQAYVPGVIDFDAVTRAPLATAYARTDDSEGFVGAYNGTTLAVATPGPPAYSWLIRFKTPAVVSGQQCVLGADSANGNFGFHAIHVDPSYSGAVYQSGVYDIIGKPTGGALAASTWYTVGCTFDGTTAALFNDGLYVTPTNSTPSAVTLATGLGLGATYGGAEPLTGMLTLFYYIWTRGCECSEMAYLSQPNAYWSVFETRSAPVYFLQPSANQTFYIDPLMFGAGM